MKKYFVLAIALLGFGLESMAQKKGNAGAIIYEITIEPAVLAAANGINLGQNSRLPAIMKSEYELLFNATNASYLPVINFEDSNSGNNNMNFDDMDMGGGNEGGGGGGNNRFSSGNKDMYFSFADKKVFEVMKMNDTTFIVPSQLRMQLGAPQGMGAMMGGQGRQGMMGGQGRQGMPGGQGRPGMQGGQGTQGGQQSAQSQDNSGSIIQYSNEPPVVELIKTDETKEMFGLNAKKAIVRSTRKATLLGTERNIIDDTTIWYTTDLGFDFSPNPNLWLEGVVLSIEARGNTIIAKKINFRNVSLKDTTPGKKDVTLSKEEYEAKMMRNFRSNQGGGMQRPTGQGPVRNIVIN